MATPVEHFVDNMARVRALVGIFAAVKSVITGAVDLSDILRAAVVLAVSAFDHYIHEIVRVRMLEVQAGRRLPTQSFSNFRVSMASVDEALNFPSDNNWLENEIRLNHGWQSFQRPDNAARAVSLISSIPLWDAVASKLGRNTGDVKRQLELIVDRRNKIAHEADSDPTSPGSRWPIDETLVETAVAFLEDIVTAIDALV